MIYTDKQFVEIDVVLRRGGHINRSNFVAYQFLIENYIPLKKFYEGYGCNLVQHQDGFFFLLSQGSIIRSKLLPIPCMHLGMFIALKMRDPEITSYSGRIPLRQLLQAMEASIPRETLQKVYAPKQREASADARITEEIQKALRILADLNFVQIQGEVIRPTEAIHRFAELARHNNTPDEPTKLMLAVQRGVVFHKAEEEEFSEGVYDNESSD